MKKLSLSGKVALCVAGVAIAAAIADVQFHRAPPHALDSQIAQLEAELASLGKATPAARQKAESAIVVARESLWTPERFDAFRAELPPGWIVSELGTPETKTVTQRRYSIERPQSSFDDWSEIVRTLTQIAGRPGLTIRTLTLTAAPRPARVLTRVLVVATIAYANADEGKQVGLPQPVPAVADQRAGSTNAKNLAPEARPAGS
jgi:hypothetical protein